MLYLWGPLLVSRETGVVTAPPGQVALVSGDAVPGVWEEAVIYLLLH